MVIFCKSYAGDIGRATKLWHSIQQFNTSSLPVHFSVPAADIKMFRETLGEGVIFHEDESILSELSTGGRLDRHSIKPHLLQQIVKIAFHRVVPTDHYLVIDSDSRFIRPFRISDFVHESGTPYTIIHESKELLTFTARSGMKNVRKNYDKERERSKALLDRTGLNYDFGPTPVIWSSSAWKMLELYFLQPRKWNFYDLIQNYPCELQLYGETLLKYEPYTILPREPLFRVYHYKEQYDEALHLGETEVQLAENYLGVVMQSNWYQKHPKSSRTWRTLLRRPRPPKR